MHDANCWPNINMEEVASVDQELDSCIICQVNMVVFILCWRAWSAYLHLYSSSKHASFVPNIQWLQFILVIRRSCSLHSPSIDLKILHLNSRPDDTQMISFMQRHAIINTPTLLLRSSNHQWLITNPRWVLRIHRIHLDWLYFNLFGCSSILAIGTFNLFHSRVLEKQKQYKIKQK